MAKTPPSVTVVPKPIGFTSVGLGALIVCASFVAYLPSLLGEFIWNDSDYVTAPALRSLRGLARIWTDVGATQQYYPLLHSAFWLQHRFFGDQPLGYHIVTLLLHAGSAVLFAVVLNRLFKPDRLGPVPAAAGVSRPMLRKVGPGPASPPRSYAAVGWLAAMLFALHPVHVESVAWITEQKNTLSLVFYLGAALAYLRYDETRQSWSYFFALALFALSLLCKTVTATLPAALLVIFWWKRGRISWRRDVTPLLPLLALGAAAALFISWVERNVVGAQGADFDLPAIARPLVAGRAIWFYVGKLFWPADLNFIYPRWAIDARIWWQWLFPLTVFALIVALWLIRRRTRGPLAAFLFFVGSLFPVLGFTDLYGARYSWVWDHWQYLPDLGLLTLVSAALVAAWHRASPRLLWIGPVMAVALSLLLGALTWSHCAMFRDNQTLYSMTLARNPDSWMAHNNLGLAWSKVPGRIDDAVAEYSAALRLKPDIAETHTNLGNALSKIPGRLDDAVAQYEEALRLQPDYPDAHFYLANALVQTGRIPEAILHYEEALRFDPGLAEASNNLGMILCRSGRPAEGMQRIEAAIRMQPDFALAHLAHGTALLQSGRRDEAIAEYRKVLQLRPGDPSALRMLEMIGAQQ